ncbi:MAG: response regulator [Bacteroidales bacterium]|nr:response regulator [Bacteroidales bacterium]MCF8388710.1 response regulator [Bacteroidales bacterium]MCF8399503.1 response regulator [Bacteroidales bacterium]
MANNKKPNYNWQDKTILVVEDTETSTRYFEAALIKTKARLFWAYNGKDAIKIIQSEKNIDLILMDIHMPLMNGFEATKEIKKLRGDIPVIVQTAYVLSGEEEKSFEAGADAFLSKPIKYQTLLETIDKFLSD